MKRKIAKKTLIITTTAILVVIGYLFFKLQHIVAKIEVKLLEAGSIAGYADLVTPAKMVVCLKLSPNPSPPVQ